MGNEVVSVLQMLGWYKSIERKREEDLMKEITVWNIYHNISVTNKTLDYTTWS